MPELIWTSIFIGIFVGAVLGLTGAGGAILTIPLLVYFYDLTVLQAAPIALLTVLIASAIGSIQGLLQGIVRYKAALLIAIIGSIVAPLGVTMAAQLPASLLTILMVLILLYIGLRSFQGYDERDPMSSPSACEINPVTSRLFWTAACTRLLLLIGVLTGFLSGLLGVGGGFLIVPALKKVSDLPHATVVATTLSVITLVSISAFLSFLKSSSVQWALAIPLVLGASITLVLLNQFKARVPVKRSQQLFAILCLIASISMLKDLF